MHGNIRLVHSPQETVVNFLLEARWVRDRLADPVHRGLGMRYLTHLKAVWKRAHKRDWDVWTEFPKEEEFANIDSL